VETTRTTSTRTRSLLALALGVGGLLGGSCGGDRDGGGVNGPLLSPLASCGEVELRVRADALRQMHARLDAQLASALDGGGGCWEVDADGSGPPSAGPSDGSGGGASQVSGTNNQVAGVDEADFIKNDNRYIYVLGGGKLRILDAWPAATAHTLAAVPVEGTPKKLFVEGDRALVYSALPLPAGGGEDTPYAGSWGNGECTYGYGCAFTGDGHPLRITIFDLTDRAAPVLVRTIETSGSYVNARRIGTAASLARMKLARRLVATIWSQSSIFQSSSGALLTRPALPMRISSLP